MLLPTPIPTLLLLRMTGLFQRELCYAVGGRRYGLFSAMSLQRMIARYSDGKSVMVSAIL